MTSSGCEAALGAKYPLQPQGGSPAHPGGSGATSEPQPWPLTQGPPCRLAWSGMAWHGLVLGNLGGGSAGRLPVSPVAATRLTGQVTQ